MEKIIHIFQLATNQVCSPYRFEIPGSLLNELSYFRITRIHKLDAAAYQQVLEEADILIVQRLPMSATFEKVCRALKAAGKLVVFEIDDNLMHLPPDSRYARQAPPDYSDRIKESILICPAIQCSTLALAEAIEPIQSNVVVLENQLDRVLPLDHGNKPEKFIICYAAGEDHYLDWLTIKDEFNRTISKLETKGYGIETWIIGDRAIYESIDTTRKKFIPILPRRDYLRLMTAVDLALLPLDNNPFNHCKSDVKFLESASAGALVLASHVVYSKTVKHGETGFLYKHPGEFGDQLIRLVQQPEILRSVAENAHRYISEHRLMRYHVSKWAKTYQNWYVNRRNLLDRRPNPAYRRISLT